MIKAIIFDVHGVLDRRTFGGLLKLVGKNLLYTALKGKPIADPGVQAVREAYLDLSLQYVSGQMRPEDFWHRLRMDFNDELVDAARDYLLKMEPNDELVSLLPQLKERYRLALLTDCPEDKKKVVLETLDPSLFDVMCFSCDTKLLKKQRESFDDCLEKLSLSAEHCMFVDDNQKNISLSESIGFQSCLFKKASSLTGVLAI